MKKKEYPCPPAGTIESLIESKKPLQRLAVFIEAAKEDEDTLCEKELKDLFHKKGKIYLCFDKILGRPELFPYLEESWGNLHQSTMVLHNLTQDNKLKLVMKNQKRRAVIVTIIDELLTHIDNIHHTLKEVESSCKKTKRKKNES